MMKFLLFCFNIIILHGLTACSIMSASRSESSGYTNYDGPTYAQEFYIERKSRLIEDAKEELGLAGRSELSEQEINALKARIELNHYEKNLVYEVEKKQYYSLKPYFRNDRERIQFLKLPDLDSRSRWANRRNLTTQQTVFEPAINKLIEHNDIARGMTRSAVHQSWGEPDIVEVAGDQLHGNERWRYTKLVASEAGYNNETRIIYFEGGIVVGWETL